MQIDTPTATVIGAIVGAGVGGLVTLIGQWLVRRSEERRQLRQLVMQAAVENWRYASEAAEKAGAHRYPLDSYILHMLKLVELLDTRRLTPELVREKLREVHAVTRAASEEIERYTEELDRPTT
jgi:hypothetical protein